LYEKAGSVTNTYGDQQLVKKAGDRAGVRTDFELMVRIADKHGRGPKKLVPFGRGHTRTWARPAARSPAKRTVTSVWLAAQIIWSRSSAPSTPLPFSMRSSAWCQATRCYALELLSRKRRPCAIIEPGATSMLWCLIAGTRR
jgi:hypothetical protein